MARVYSVLLKKALPKKPSPSRNGATQPRTDSIVQSTDFVVFVYVFKALANNILIKSYAHLKKHSLTANHLTD